MNVSKIAFSLLFLSSLLTAEQFDYYEFMNGLEKEKEKTESSFSFNWFSNEEVDEDASYSQKKYGRTLKYQTYDEIKAERKKRNTLLMVGAEYRKLKIYEKVWGRDDLGQPVDIIGVTESKDEEYNPSIYMSTLLDLKYFNIQEEKKNTYLGVGIGKYIDIDLQWDLADGRTTDFYAMVGPMLRVNMKDSDRLLDFGLQGTLGYFITENVGIFYSAKYTGENFISEDFQYLIEKDGISRTIDQYIYIGTKF